MKNIYQREERERHRRADNTAFILQAAENVFAQWGYSLATMDAIAAEAQFSKATLYRYFRSKKEIFLKIILNSLDTAHRRAVEIYEKPLKAEDKMREYIQLVMSYYKQKESFIKIIFMEKQALMKIFNIDFKGFPIKSVKHPDIPPEFMTKMENMSKIISAIIKDGIKTGEFRNVNVQHASFVLGALIRGFHFRGPLPEKEFTVNDSVEIILKFFFNGIKNK